MTGIINSSEHTVRLTHAGEKRFAEKIANGINKDYPGQAIAVMNGKGFVCCITAKYNRYCKEYVLNKCRIKEEVRS